MTDKSHNCGPCSRKQKVSLAYKHCSDCEDYFCWLCYRHHGTFKPLLKHKVGDYDRTPDTISKLDLCVAHLRSHCQSCLTNRNRDSENIDQANDWTIGIMTSLQKQHFQEQLKAANDCLGAVSRQYEQRMEKLKRLSRLLQNQVKKFKAEILQHVNNLEQELLSEIESTISNEESTAERLKNDIKSCTLVLKEIDERYHSSDLEICAQKPQILVERFNDKVLPNVFAFVDQTQTLNYLDITFCRSDILSRMKSLGSIKMAHENAPSTIRPKYTLPVQQTYVPRKLKLEKTYAIGKLFPFTATEITGMGITRDDRLILCNRAESKILLCSQNFKEREEIELSGNPWTIAIDPEADEAWVTIPDKNSIQRVEFRGMAADDPLLVASGCFGISLLGDNIALGRWGEVQIINREGHCLKSLEVGKSTIHSLLVGRNWSLYCCEGDQGKLHCIRTHDGVSKYAYETDEFKWPISVVTDIQDNLYVLGLKSHNLHRLNPKGQFLDAPLSESDDLDFPRCMTFNKNYSKLFVSNNLGKSISVYICKYV